MKVTDFTPEMDLELIRTLRMNDLDQMKSIEQNIERLKEEKLLAREDQKMFSNQCLILRQDLRHLQTVTDVKSSVYATLIESTKEAFEQAAKDFKDAKDQVKVLAQRIQLEKDMVVSYKRRAMLLANLERLIMEGYDEKDL